jgi:cytochrome c oxidase subunit I+III
MTGAEGVAGPGVAGSGMAPPAEWTRKRERERESLAELDRVWHTPTGLRGVSAVNHTYVGRRFIITGFIFFLIAGVLALVMRTQLAVPDNTLLGHDAYNQIFTMHGTMMMFLFAIPILEGIAMYLLPLMIAARDLPYPRLSAFGYWCYLFGGTMLLSSLLFGSAPDGGWFIYPPLTSYHFSPGINIDFWLLGITFVEISAIAASIELIVAVLRTRAPGMTIDRMPLFAWYILITAFMIVFGFPPLILGSILLELERAFEWPFFVVAQGGDALLWQHLFWLFGHPEVYIILLPGVAMLTALVPTFARHRTVGYRWFVLAALVTGFFGFGVWVHHMYAVGISQLPLAFFTAATLLFAIPSGIQVFGLIATLWKGRPVIQTPLLFAIGFLLIFVIGGFTGVMIAIAPFDLVVHDTQFIVAHFHYVLIGGMLFPLFAGLYYWLPTVGSVASERAGRWSFWLTFIGFNVTFLPLHWTGLLGMPRRVFTYPDGVGWEPTNFVATIGSYIFALGVLVAVINIVWSLRRGIPAGDNPWGGGTLEWVQNPVPSYNFRSIPKVQSRDPIWDEIGIGEAIKEGKYYLASPTDRRYTIGSTTVHAQPDQVVELPGPTYVPLYTGLCIAVFFVSFLLEIYPLAVVGAFLAVFAIVIWMWPAPDRDHPKMIAAGCGIDLPHAHGLNNSPAWPGLILTILADVTLYASLVFSYLFLWSFAPAWPRADAFVPPDLQWSTVGLGVLLLAASVLALKWGRDGIRRDNRKRLLIGFVAALGLSAAFLLTQIFAVMAFDFRPTDHSYGALAHVLVGYHAIHLMIAMIMGGMVVARILRGDFNAERHVAVRIATTFWYYSAALWIVGFILVYLAPFFF